ncbi:hypothetical protein U5922_001270 [Aquicoccus sp. G2-2]|uniref:hypothetical protein n=1 Tax=Aquicoccus sp. G2-2 TaxID=3092120 RepID=UPI002AE02159|nr:hypothetical protein [Aquicoccus sp. G2-2]MEA1112159.1 hypothetical protein [Aquicoccus sp. G2-2]
MVLRLISNPLLFIAISFSLSAPLAAQTVDEVKTDVLSALSTPLPITVIGPLLTREVVVSEEAGGFRAVLKDTSLMGLFRFGDVSFHVDPAGADAYRVSDLTFEKTLEFPGIGVLTVSGMDFDGTWSTKTRSYSALKWLTSGLMFRPDMGAQQNGQQGAGASVSIGSLLFDVLKEPVDGNAESRFAITAGQLAVTGMGPQNVSLGEVKAVLAANGKTPVDLYSVLREVMMLGSVRDGGARLQALGQSLLGNTYDTVSLDLSARDVAATSTRKRNEYFKASTLHVTAALRDVEPRSWGGVDVTLRFGDVDQRNFLPDSAVRLDEAVVRVSGGELPVADMMAAFMTMAEPPRHRPVAASALLDGLLGFGKLEIASEGKNVWTEVFGRRFDNGDYVRVKEFETSFERWRVDLGISGLNKNQGTATLGTEFAGGTFIPGDGAPKGITAHINAWFPKELTLRSSVTNMNEALLKRMFKDVQIQNLREPVEIVLPLVLYGAATVLDVTAGRNVYETALFRIEQDGHYRFFPTEVMSMMPYDGEVHMSMTGLPALQAYFDETAAQMRPRSDEAMALGAAKSALTVLRNLAVKGDGDAFEWTITRPDVTSRELVMNGITLRYPDLVQYLPMFAAVGMMR